MHVPRAALSADFGFSESDVVADGATLVTRTYLHHYNRGHTLACTRLHVRMRNLNALLHTGALELMLELLKTLELQPRCRNDRLEPQLHMYCQ